MPCPMIGTEWSSVHCLGKALKDTEMKHAEAYSIFWGVRCGISFDTIDTIYCKICILLR